MSRFPGSGGFAARVAAFVAAAALLAGCAGTAPISNFWRLYGFGQDDVVRMDPAAMRVAVKLPLPARPHARDTILRLEFDPAAAIDGSTDHDFPMILVNQGGTVRAGELPSARPGYNWYLFKLTTAAERELSRVQAALAEAGGEPNGSVTLSVINRIENAVPGQELSRSIWIQFSEGEDFKALVDEENITFGEDGQSVR